MKEKQSRLLHPATALVLAAVYLFFPGEALALKDAENQGRWTEPCKEGPDAEVPGFLVNMGPTGARGILKENSYVVKYVFSKSPAKGVLEIDDEVYGAATTGSRGHCRIWGWRSRIARAAMVFSS